MTQKLNKTTCFTKIRHCLLFDHLTRLILVNHGNIVLTMNLILIVWIVFIKQSTMTV